MNRFLDRLVELYTPLRLRGLLMDGQYRFAPDERPTLAEPRTVTCRSRFSGDPAPAGKSRPTQAPFAAEAAPTVAPLGSVRQLLHR